MTVNHYLKSLDFLEASKVDVIRVIVSQDEFIQ